jgi:hypothetical protein
METGATCRLINSRTGPLVMKIAPPNETTCMLCDELMALDHSVAITAVGLTPPVRCCPECYAMFCDMRTVLQLTPFTFAAPQPRLAGVAGVVPGEDAQCRDQMSARLEATVPL